MGMRPPRLIAPIFEGTSPKEIAWSRDAITAGVIGLMLMDCAWLKHNPNAPKLYDSGVIYVPEARRIEAVPTSEGWPTGSKCVVEYGENWLTIPAILKVKKGDCEDLAAWRSAELRMAGIKATPFIKIRKLANGSWRAHAVVKWPCGKIEDPSAKLGMFAFS